MNLREAAQMALDTLEADKDHVSYASGIYSTILALRAALAEQEQEPVAWMVEDFRSPARFSTDKRTPAVAATRADHIVTPLYTHPAPIPEGWKLVPVEPTEEMIEQGAQGMASFQETSVWPDSWEPVQVRGMRHDAKKAWRYMVIAAPEYKP